MKSPFTGKEMKPVYERRTWKFRGEEYTYIHTGWLCEDTGEQFTNDTSDDAGFRQVTNQYRERYGIPYTDEIVATRRKYGLSASKMALVLGIGTNQYRLYEQGEVPSVSNGKMIRSVANPQVMRDLVEGSRPQLEAKEYDRLQAHIDGLVRQKEDLQTEQYEAHRIFAVPRGKGNGYAVLSMERLKNILLYIIGQCGDVFCTKMNKLLFFTDFLSYRQQGMALTGLSYRAIGFGPVPQHWDRVYSAFDEIRQEPCIGTNYEGIILTSDVKADTTLFSAEDRAIMDTVCRKFAQATAREISEVSHREDAWKDFQGKNIPIDFDEAFKLTAF